MFIRERRKREDIKKILLKEKYRVCRLNKTEHNARA
jgi:hypothetical protein